MRAGRGVVARCGSVYGHDHGGGLGRAAVEGRGEGGEVGVDLDGGAGPLQGGGEPTRDAEDRPGAVVDRGDARGAVGQRDPRDAVQGVGAGGRREPLRAGPPGGDGAGQDGGAGGVVGVHRPGVLADGRQGDLESGGSGGVHGDVPPGGGQHRGGGVVGGRRQGDGGLQKRRVEAEAGGVRMGALGQFDVGQERVAGASQGPYGAERGVQVESAAVDQVVGPIEVDGGGRVGGRAGAGFRRGGVGVRGGGEDAGRVAGPRGGACRVTVRSEEA